MNYLINNNSFLGIYIKVDKDIPMVDVGGACVAYDDDDLYGSMGLLSVPHTPIIIISPLL